jgi:hypothetical protein
MRSQYYGQPTITNCFIFQKHLNIQDILSKFTSTKIRRAKFRSSTHFHAIFDTHLIVHAIFMLPFRDALKHKK